MQTGIILAPWQRSAEPVCGVGGAELERSALHLQDKLRAQGWQPVHSQCRTMPVPKTGKGSGHLCYWEFSGSTFSSNSQFPREFPEQVHTSPWHITHHSAPSARTHTGCPLCNSLIWQQRSSANSPKALKIILKAPIPLLIMNLPFLTPGTSSHDSHFHSLPSSPASESTASSPKFAAPCCFSLFCRGKLSAATA